MTNADCIRRMNDEQLYDFLSEWECGDIDYSITFCDLCKQGGNELNLDCDGCRKHWLQRDAVDVGGLMYWKRNTTFDTNADRKTEPTISKEEIISNAKLVGYQDGVKACNEEWLVRLGYKSQYDEPQTERTCTNCKHNGVLSVPKCDECHGMDKHEFIEPQTERGE